jgi:histone acetyltransferase (RNA polymerase elongator complex component)
MRAKRCIIPLFVPHAGCIHNCVFCDQTKVTGKTTPIKACDVQETVRTAISVIKDDQPVEIAFFGGSFTAMPITIQNELLEAALPFMRGFNSIRVSTRPDSFCANDADRLKKYGVKTVEFGVQSMCDDVLAATKRGHSSDDVVRAFTAAKKAELDVVLQMMTGLPEDTFEKSLKTAKDIISLKPDAVRIYPTVVVEGTELHEMWKRGEYKEHTLEQAIELCAEICELFWHAKIPIIRLGLNPTKEFSMGAAVAGAYHPAFGELVYSSIYLRKAVNLLTQKGVAPESDLIIGVSKGRISMMTGYCRSNILALRKKFLLRSLKIVEADIPAGQICLM